MDHGLVMILSGFPRRSETFALNEVIALHERGLLTAIFATKPGDGQQPHPDYARIQDDVHYLPQGTAVDQASAIVEVLNGRPIAGVHAYFAHFPTEVAMVVAQRLGVPYGFSVHARDARKVTPVELANRARHAACVVACNPDVTTEFSTEDTTIHLMPHGVDHHRFRPQPLSPDDPVQLLAVGRLVEKKGFDVLIQAVAQLSIPFSLRIIGDGPERNRLATMVESNGLADHVALCPSLTHAELPVAYAAAHIVIVPSIIDRSGDRDGLPNVLLEAMASGRAVIGSDVGAISSAITYEYNGLLVPSGDSTPLAWAITRLAQDTALQQTLGRNARARIERDFTLDGCTEQFCQLLTKTYDLSDETIYA